MTRATDSLKLPRRGARRSFAWHGWRLSTPAAWDALRLEGDAGRGEAMLADLDRPRVGLRWRRGGRRVDADAWVAAAMRDEVGKLAAGEAQALSPEPFVAGRLYIEPAPPGRDVWIGYSPATRRLLQVVYHAARRDTMLRDVLLPGLRDDGDGWWSVFDLSTRVGGSWRLSGRRLNAGDLSLTFERRGGWLSVRQIAPAALALARRPLDQWFADHQQWQRRFFRAAPERGERDVATHDGRRLTALAGEGARRRRYFFVRRLPPRLWCAAVHDAARDRIALVQGWPIDEAQAALAWMGWASSEARA